MMCVTYIPTRTQIYLGEDQDRRLAERARETGQTKSALIRDAIDAYLSPVDTRDSALAALRRAVAEAAGVASNLPSGSDYVDDVRAAERERQQAIERSRRSR